MEWQSTLSDKQLAEQALASAEHAIRNQNTGLSRLTTQRKQTRCTENNLSVEGLNSHFKENVDPTVPITYRRSFGWHPDEDEPLSPSFLVQEKSPIVNRARTQEVQRSIAGKRRQDTPAPTLTSKRRRLHVLDRAVERKLLRRARQSVRELEWKLWQPSIPRPMLSTFNALSSCMLSFSPNDVSKVLCCGCTARLAVGNQDVLDKWRDQLKEMVGHITPRQAQTSGLTVIQETTV